MNRLPNLDILRFFLASLVVLFHVPQLSQNQSLPFFDEWPIFHRGTEAVYMFFVLSGFLIIGQIYQYKKEQRFSIRNFYARRALRILPLYYLIVVFGFVYYNIVIPAAGFNFEINYTLPEGLLLTFFFLPNVFSSLYEPGGIHEILWSIGIEEQFYLLIAPLSFLLPKRFILSGLLVLASSYFIVFHSEIGDTLSDFGMVYFYLFTGGIVAILELEKKLEFLKKLSVFPIAIVIFAMLFFSTNLFSVEIPWIRNLMLCISFSFFVHTIAYNNRGVVIKSSLLTYLGRISYGIYMYHAIAMNLVVFIFLSWKVALPDWSMILLNYVLVFAITFGIAHISYKYFEAYFLNLKSKFRK